MRAAPTVSWSTRGCRPIYYAHVYIFIIFWGGTSGAKSGQAECPAGRRVVEGVALSLTHTLSLFVHQRRRVSLSHTLSLTHTHTCTLSLSHTHSLTLTHTCTHRLCPSLCPPATTGPPQCLLMCGLDGSGAAHAVLARRVAGCRVQGAGCRVQGSWCRRVLGAGCRVHGAGCRV